VPRCVDDVDRQAAFGRALARVAHRGVLGEDGDALLALEVTGVHDPIRHFLMARERAGLAEHGIDQGGLAVVDVGDDRHVAQVVT